MTAAHNDVASLLALYDIGTVRDMQVLGGGMFLKPTLVTTDRGRYVLRGHKFRPTLSAFQFQAVVLGLAGDAGLRCPRVMRDREGRMGHERDGVCWALQTYLDGHMYSWQAWREAKADRTFVRGLGVQLAAVHNALKAIGDRMGEGVDGSVLPPSLPPMQFVHLDAIRRHWNAGMESLAQWKSPAAPCSVDAFLSARSRLAACWDWLFDQARKHGIAQWPRRLVHGDFSPVNLVFDAGGRQFGLIDWDCLHYGHRLYDALGDILNRPPSELAGSSSHEIDLLAVFLDGYRECVKPTLAADELAAAPAFCLARQFEDLRQRLHVLPELPSEKDAEYARLIGARLRVIEQISRMNA